MNGDIVPPSRDQARNDSPRRVPQPLSPPAQSPLPPTQPTPNPCPKSSKKKYVLIGVFATALILILAALIIWMTYMNNLKAVAPKSDEKVKVTIQPGSSPEVIGQALKRADVIRDTTAFNWYVRLNGKSGLLQSGSYRLSKSEDVPRIVQHLTTGKTDTFSITFLPGATLADHRKVLLDAGYSTEEVDMALNKSYDMPLFEGKPSGTDLEGYIYGETYSFTVNSSVEDILMRSFEEYQSVITRENLVAQYKTQGFNLYQGITMASIIQREVATAEDAAQVAQVFKLRLDRDIQLGSDVTYQYIADKTGQQRSVDLDSPYNTRRYKGLPPGPIASPGLAALRAVARPAPGSFVYFLSGDDDKTYFAYTEEEHQRNIRDHCARKCQII